MKAVSKDSITRPLRLSRRSSAQATQDGPPALSESELLAILIFSSLTENHQRLKEVYEWAGRVYPGWFRLPNYANFVATAHRAAPVMAGSARQPAGQRGAPAFTPSLRPTSTTTR